MQHNVGKTYAAQTVDSLWIPISLWFPTDPSVIGIFHFFDFYYRIAWLGKNVKGIVSSNEKFCSYLLNIQEKYILFPVNAIQIK